MQYSRRECKGMMAPSISWNWLDSAMGIVGAVVVGTSARDEGVLLDRENCLRLARGPGSIRLRGQHCDARAEGARLLQVAPERPRRNRARNIGNQPLSGLTRRLRFNILNGRQLHSVKQDL